MQHKPSKHEGKTFICPYCGRSTSMHRIDQATCGRKRCKQLHRRGEGAAITPETPQCQIDAINRWRQSQGMRPLEPGCRPCHNCGQVFWSWDRRSNILCDECKTPKEDI